MKIDTLGSVMTYMGIFTLISMGACDEPKEKEYLSTDMVTNPVSAYSDTSANDTQNRASISFETKEMDFGSIVEGTVVKKEYAFTNVGSVDLIISSANGSCGCTIPKWPKKPIKPGEKASIEVVFNSRGKKGKQTKKIYITANTHPVNNIIVLTGVVVAPK